LAIHPLKKNPTKKTKKPTILLSYKLVKKKKKGKKYSWCMGRRAEKT